MMENLPFSFGWGWDISLSLEKVFEGAAGAILRWLSFELWNFLDCTMGSCGEFSFKYRSMALCTSLRDSSPLLCFFLWPQRRTLHSGPCQVLAAPFVPRYIFQDGGIGTSTSFGGRSFIHCFVERVERLRMFSHSDRVKVLYCFVWNCWEPGNMYLLEMTMNLLLCLVCMLYWTRYHTDLEQMLKKRQNIRQMDTECWKLLVKKVSSPLSFRN